jgi:hypothetical protein
MNNTEKSEVWKDFTRPVWAKKKKFKVSNFGRIINLSQDAKSRSMKLYNLAGYEVFSIQKKDGKTDLIYMHRLVAELFLEADSERPSVIHKNFNKLDNHVGNLKYVNKTERFVHNQLNPAVIASKRKAVENPKYAKLSGDKVRMIKRKLFDPNRKTRMRLIAKQFGISEMQLYRIKSGENWGHITDY